MKIQIKDIEDWTARDFISYIYGQCTIKNIEINLDTRRAYMFVGRIFKILALNNKSKAWLKSKIDFFLSQEEVTSIGSLQFLYSAASQLPKQLITKSSTYSKDKFVISAKLKKELVKFKSSL